MWVFKYAHNSRGHNPRLSTVIWASGCSIQCKDCFNPSLFDRKAGKWLSPLKILRIIQLGMKKGGKNVSFVGGEPLDQALGLFLVLVLLRLFYPAYSVTIYSGYTYEKLIKHNLVRWALGLATVLVDGPFVEQLKNDSIGYRGSTNQRVINLKYSNLSIPPVLLNWDNQIIITPNSITTSPHLASSLGLKQITLEECGKID